MSGLAVMATFLGVYAVVERSGDLASRVEFYATPTRRDDQGEAARRRGLALFLRRLDQLLSGQPLARRLAMRLVQANLHLTVPEFFGIVLAAGAVGSAVGYVVGEHLLSAGAGATIGVLLPWLWLERRRYVRLHAFQDQLVDVLVLVVGSLRSGHGLTNALDLVSKELDAPASEEFARVLREMGFGVSQADALANLVRRVGSEDLQLIVTAVNINQEVGGNLSLVLDKIAETIRERIRLQGEIRVLTTQQRLTSYLLVGLPFILGTVLALINPDWMMRLF